jgi:hypothetical protein
MVHDKNIITNMRNIFPSNYYDLDPVQDLNDVIVISSTRGQHNSDDSILEKQQLLGPFWFLPGISYYCLLIALDSDDLIRFKFCLQHTTEDKILDACHVVGFDYNRELHVIDNLPTTPSRKNQLFLRIYYIIFPKGWHNYGKLCRLLHLIYHI